MFLILYILNVFAILFMNRRQEGQERKVKGERGRGIVGMEIGGYIKGYCILETVSSMSYDTYITYNLSSNYHCFGVVWSSAFLSG